MMWILSALGVGGAIAVAAAFFPTIAIRILTGIVDALLGGLSWFFSKLLEGLQYISASPAAIMSLAVCIVVSAYLGPAFFHRPLQQIIYAQEPAPKKVYRKKPVETDPIQSAFRDISCNVFTAC